eukprot:3351410-Amphidinium_carterae.2
MKHGWHVLDTAHREEAVHWHQARLGCRDVSLSLPLVRQCSGPTSPPASKQHAHATQFGA